MAGNLFSTLLSVDIDSDDSASNTTTNLANCLTNLNTTGNDYDGEMFYFEADATNRPFNHPGVVFQSCEEAITDNRSQRALSTDGLRTAYRSESGAYGASWSTASSTVTQIPTLSSGAFDDVDADTVTILAAAVTGKPSAESSNVTLIYGSTQSDDSIIYYLIADNTMYSRTDSDNSWTTITTIPTADLGQVTNFSGSTIESNEWYWARANLATNEPTHPVGATGYYLTRMVRNSSNTAQWVQEVYYVSGTSAYRTDRSYIETWGSWTLMDHEYEHDYAQAQGLIDYWDGKRDPTGTAEGWSKAAHATGTTWSATNGLQIRNGAGSANGASIYKHNAALNITNVKFTLRMHITGNTNGNGNSAGNVDVFMGGEEDFRPTAGWAGAMFDQGLFWRLRRFNYFHQAL